MYEFQYPLFSGYSLLMLKKYVNLEVFQYPLFSGYSLLKKERM